MLVFIPKVWTENYGNKQAKRLASFLTASHLLRSGQWSISSFLFIGCIRLD